MGVNRKQSQTPPATLGVVQLAQKRRRMVLCADGDGHGGDGPPQALDMTPFLLLCSIKKSTSARRMQTPCILTEHPNSVGTCLQEKTQK